MDLTKIDNISFEDVDWSDAPDFCDAYISEADYNGVPMNEESLDELNENRDFVYEELMKYLW